MRNVLMVALMVSAVVSAQPLRNGVERTKDRQDLRQDRRQGTDDQIDAAKARTMLGEYDRAIASNDAAQLGAIDASFGHYLAREIEESRVESAQAKQEVREDKRELRSDRRELRTDVATGRRPAVVADDVHDKNKDRRNLADDRADAAKEGLSRQRLVAIQTEAAALNGRFDPTSVQRKRALYAEVVGVAVNEVKRDQQESRDDHRELREDRRERREDRRQR